MSRLEKLVAWQKRIVESHDWQVDEEVEILVILQYYERKLIEGE